MPALPIMDGGSGSFALAKSDKATRYIVWGMVEPNSYSEAVANGLPQKGTVLINGPNPEDPATVVFKVLFQESLNAQADDPNGLTEIWTVFSSTLVGGSAGLRTTSYQTTQESERQRIPNATKHTPASGPAYWVHIPEYAQITVNRIKINRTHVKQSSGLTENQVADFDAAHVGKIKLMNAGYKFQYMGTNLTTYPTNQQLIVVRYQARMALTGFAAGFFSGNDVTVPDLPLNSDYVYKFPADPITAPSIAVINPDTYYGVCPAIPWDP